MVFDEGFSTDLPYENSSFDRVLSSLFFHHLLRDDKIATVREAFRVLKPGGYVYIADWGKPRNVVMRILSYQIRVLDGFDRTRDNIEGRLPEYIAGEAFVDVGVLREFRTVFGTITLYIGRKPLPVSGDD